MKGGAAVKFRDYLYAIAMIFFAVCAYLLFERGFNLRTKKIVNYQEKSALTYQVYLKENNEFKDEYLGMNQRYISKLVDKIRLNFNYNSLFSKNINGYYSYDVIANLYGYLKENNEQIWKNEYKLIDNKVVVLNKNNIKEINVEDVAVFDYQKCVDDFNKFKNKYDLDIVGYVDIVVNIHENLQASGISKVVTDDKLITVKVPLSQDTFRITVDNDNNNINNYYDFSKREKINYMFIIIGAFCASLTISFLALIIRNMVIMYHDKYDYKAQLNKILSEYDDIIVNIKKFYNRKKYNLIYVDTFSELLDVYNSVGNPISFREVKKNKEALFIILDEDNAWVYRLLNKF